VLPLALPSFLLLVLSEVGVFKCSSKLKRKGKPCLLALIEAGGNHMNQSYLEVNQEKAKKSNNFFLP
jgi:hypothetical protein